MDKKKVVNKRNVIIVIALLVLLAVYLIFFTSLFNKPLSSGEAIEGSALIGYDIDGDDPRFLDLISKPKTANGWKKSQYTTINNYSQYKRILQKLESEDLSYAEELKVVFEGFGYEREFFRKHSLLVIEEKSMTGGVYRNSWITEVNADAREIEVVIYLSKSDSDSPYENYYGTGSDNSIYIIPVLKKSLWTADVTVDYRKDWNA